MKLQEKVDKKGKIIKTQRGYQSKVDIIEIQDTKEIFVKKKFNKEGLTGESALKNSKKNSLIKENLKGVKDVKSPEIFEVNDNTIIMEYIKGEVFEKYYIRNITNSKKINSKLRMIVRGIHSIHRKKFSSKEELVHGDLHLENVLIEPSEEKLVLLDATTKSLYNIDESSKYLDLSTFVYNLKFKIPYKYKSFLFYLYGKKYSKYFLEEYSKLVGFKVNNSSFKKFKIRVLKNQKSNIWNLDRNIIVKLVPIIHINLRIVFLSINLKLNRKN